MNLVSTFGIVATACALTACAVGSPPAKLEPPRSAIGSTTAPAWAISPVPIAPDPPARPVASPGPPAGGTPIPAPAPAAVPAAAGTPPPAPAANGAPVAAPTPDATTKDRRPIPRVDITPLTGYTDLDRSTNTAVSLHNMYTRLAVVGDANEQNGLPGQEATQERGYETRQWLQRYLIGLKDDINLSLRVRTGSYEETISLATLSSTSDRNGSTWDRDVTHDAHNFPWFLANRDAAAPIPQLVLQFRGSRAMESGAASAALQAALGAIKTVSPQATVITKLSEPGTRERASAIDQVISKLFSSKVGETHRSDRNLVQWTAEGGVRVALRVPRSTSDWDGPLQEVGYWTIGFAPPRPSLFSQWQICEPSSKATYCMRKPEEAKKAILETKNAAAILSYPLIRNSAGDLTIKSHLLQQNWYVAAQTSFVGNVLSDSGQANFLCLTIIESMMALGLNDLDAWLVTWAAMKGLPQAKAMHPAALSNAQACVEVTKSVSAS